MANVVYVPLESEKSIQHKSSIYILRIYIKPDNVATAPTLCNEDVNNYAVVIHEEPEGGYWAEVPALPGCYSQGESVEELLVNIREAISSVLEVMAESPYSSK